jgi:AcrR family transcriptional regulator
MAPDSYHHGALRETLIRAALEVIEEEGPGALSLRELARRVGVSHAASAHHFGDKAGLLTAIAVEGQELLAAAMAEAFARTGEFLEMGVAYVRVAVEHRAHFEVVYRPDLYHADDPELLDAQRRTGEIFQAGLATLSPQQAGPDPAIAGIAAWSLVHGFSLLWLNGLVQPDVGDSPEPIARAAAALLFREHAATPARRRAKA